MWKIRLKKTAILCIGAGTVVFTAACQTKNKNTEPQETIMYEGVSYLKSELSEETRIWLERYLDMPEDDRLFIDYVPHELIQGGAIAVETVNEILNQAPVSEAKLTDAPEIHFTDVLSSTINRFTLRSGNYQWNYRENGETAGMTACGVHPLGIDPEHTEKLKVPDYTGLDGVPFAVFFDVMPDELIVESWGLDARENYEQEPISRIVCEEIGMIKLMSNQIYSIHAVWKDDQYDTRGFYGNASYTLLTE